jgi:hypothetical protein
MWMGHLFQELLVVAEICLCYAPIRYCVKLVEIERVFLPL